MKIISDWTNDLSYSSLPARDGVIWNMSYMFLFPPCWKDECPLPHPSCGCAARSGTILPLQYSHVVCFMEGERNRFPRNLLHCSPGAQALALPQPASRAKVRNSCQKVTKSQLACRQMLEPCFTLGYTRAPTVNLIFVSRLVRTII